MSARVTAIVWSRFPGCAGEMLLALALADQATDLGEYIAIDIQMLVKKTRQSKDTVVAQLRRMAEQQLIEQMVDSKAFRFVPDWLLGSQAVQAPAEDPAKAAKRIAARGSRLTTEWVLPPDYKAWALATFPAWTDGFVAMVADRFRDHWTAASGQQAVKVDWAGTWRNWCRREPAVPPVTAVGTGVSGEWWLSAKLIEAKAKELDIHMIDGELFAQFKARVFRAAGEGPWMKQIVSSTTNQGFQSVGQMTAHLQQQRGNSAAA